MKDNKKSKVGIYIGVAVFVCIAAVFFLTKSGTFKKLVDRFKGDKAEEWAEDPENTSDWMSEDYESGVTLYVFRMDGETYTVDGTERVEVDEQLEDGRFYKLVADVTFLNGGVAGYYNYPQIEQVLSCDEIEPSDLKLPAISEKIYGLVNIGDYADGDILFNNYYEAYVWEDGEWIWKFEKMKKNEDGSILYYREGLSEDDAKKGIEDGILACADYILLPATEK